MIPIVFSPAVLEGVTALTGAVRTGHKIVPHFSALFEKAQATIDASRDAEPIVEDRPPAHKITEKQTRDFRSEKPDAPAVAVHAISGQPLKPISPHFSFGQFGAASQPAPEGKPASHPDAALSAAANSLNHKTMEKHSGETHSGKPDNPVVPVQHVPVVPRQLVPVVPVQLVPVVPVQPVPGQPLKPMSLRSSPAPLDPVSQAAPEGEASANRRITESAESDSNPQVGPQPAPNLSPIAFTLNLEKFGTPDQKTEVAGPRHIDSAQPAPSSAAPAVPGPSGESSSSNGSSHQPEPKEREPVDAKAEQPGAIKQDAAVSSPHDLQPVPGAANTALYSPASVESHPQLTSKGVSDAPAPAAPPVEAPATPAPASPRHIDLSVPDHDGRPVDIRIAQRGADVQVTVRTPDGGLAQSLRHHLPELSENLSRTGMRNELFQAAQSQSSETPNGSGQQQSQQQPEARRQASAKGGNKNQQSGSFAEIIQAEKGSNN